MDLPDMIPFESDAGRSVYRSGEKPQTSRLVLFLRQEPTIEKESPEQMPASHQHWVGATSWNKEAQMKTSFVWLQDSRVFCFLPDSEFTDIFLQDCGMTWVELMMKTRKVLHEQRVLKSIVEIPDKRARADELAPFIQSDYRLARTYVFKQMEICGEDGLPTLRGILNDQAAIEEHGQAIEALVEIEGPKAGPELTALLETDLSFWRSVGPTLKGGWQNDDRTPQAPLTRRYSRTVDLVRALEDIRFAGGRRVIAELRDLWQSVPPMNKADSHSEMIDECNRVLSELPNN
jgi:hypothetical protein